jgi:hypothetical protein
MASQKPHDFWQQCNASNASNDVKNVKPGKPSSVCGPYSANSANVETAWFSEAFTLEQTLGAEGGRPPCPQ